jgi:uncharacterized protein (DUF58 family)
MDGAAAKADEDGTATGAHGPFLRPTRLRFAPGKRLLQGLAALAVVGLASALLTTGDMATFAWGAAATMFGLAVLLDVMSARRMAGPEQLSAVRLAPSALALGVEGNVELTIRNAGQRGLRLSVFDHLPAALLPGGLPAEVTVPPGSQVRLSYRVRPVRRGPADFGEIEVLIDSTLGFWRCRRWLGEASRTRIYPNFAAVAHYASLATNHRLARVGVRKRRRRGEGSEFHQLRGYRDGDSLRQIDWKATTRHSKLISREYQEERDQRLVFMLDASRRMRAQDGELSHFDQALDSMMLLAHVALRQGDAVGAMAFGHEPGEHRFFAPIKGGTALERLTNAFYDLQPRPRTGDYLEAAKALVRKLPKRSLVVMLTNLRDEDEDELGLALRILRTKHLVVLASLRESALDGLQSRPVVDLDSALSVAAGHVYMAERERAFSRLVDRQVLALDVPPARLPIALVNKYMEVKRSGRL